MKLKNVFAILAMLMVVFMAGCNKKDANFDEPAPLVESTNPADLAVGLPINSRISATFDVVMDASTINGANFTLQQGSKFIAGTVAYTGTTATFTPTAKLVANTVYTATITKNARDKNGKPMEQGRTWSFTTGNTADDTSPEVLSTGPVNGAIGVPFNNVITVTFTKPMDQTTITPLTFMLNQGTTALAGAVNTAGAVATFTPAVNLKPKTTYTVTIKTGVKDMVGNSLLSLYTFSFTTGDAPAIVPPTVSLTDPIIAAKGVALDKAVKVTFVEAMNPLTIKASTFTVTDGITPVAGTITYLGKTATFTPTGGLLGSKTYTVTITTGVKNLANIALASNYTFSFSTIVVLPTVLSTDPLDNAIGVAESKVVSLTFSTAMDPLTFNVSAFTLMQGTNAVAGTVGGSGTTITFTPSTALLPGTVYTATATTSAKDLLGNGLLANKVWSFTTVVVPPIVGNGLAPVLLGAAANYVILAKSAINNTPTSAIIGDIAVSPSAETFITGFALTDAIGFATAIQVTGKVYAATMAPPIPDNLTTAVNNMETAYTDAAGRSNPTALNLGAGNLGGLTVAAGLYKFTTAVLVTTNVTLSGNANDVWIFQIPGDLTLSSAVRINLVGGALAKNIFWQVAGIATIGTTAHFEGVILSKTGITLQTGASINGRALAQTAVILDGNAVTQPAAK